MTEILVIWLVMIPIVVFLYWVDQHSKGWLDRCISCGQIIGYYTSGPSKTYEDDICWNCFDAENSYSKGAKE